MARFLIILSALLLSNMATAKDVAVGNWSYSIEKNVRSASTFNDAGNLFGVWCYSSSATECAFQLSVDISCEQDSIIPVLINSDGGAVHLTVTCGVTKSNNGNFYFLRFAEFDQIKNITEGSQWFGVAFPMASGQFKVVRFSMVGSRAAIKALTDSPSIKDAQYL